MSILVPINGVNYIIPEPNEVGWGSNLDAFFVAISAGVLQKTGGNFVLSAEADFGSSFGLKSLYYKSRGANISSTGVLRLNNNSDAISFRNAANNADLPIIVNASDQLLYNGNPVLTGTSPSSFVSSILGTANQVIASSPTGTVTLSLPQSIATSSSPTFAGLTLSSPLTVANGGTGNASLTAFNILAAGTTSTGALQTITVGASGQVLTSNGAGSLPSFQNVSGTGTVNSGTQFQLGYYATSTNAISGTSNLVTDAGGHLTIRPTTNQLVLGGTGGANTVTINGVAPITSNFIISIPGLTESCSFVVTDSGVPQTIAATKTFTATQIFKASSGSSINILSGDTTDAPLMIGADEGANTLTNATTKYGWLSTPHYTNAQASIIALSTESTSTENIIRVGGGSPAGTPTSATAIRFFTSSSNTNTSGGTFALDIDSSQNVNVKGNTKLQIAGNQVYPIVQVVFATSTTTTATSSATYQSTNTTATITPKFNTSKILIQVTSNGDVPSTGVELTASLFRGATDLDPGANGFANIELAGPTFTLMRVPIAITYYDSPATTSATTYTVKVKSPAGAGTVTYGTGVQTITLTEIAQ